MSQFYSVQSSYGKFLWDAVLVQVLWEEVQQRLKSTRDLLGETYFKVKGQQLSGAEKPLASGQSGFGAREWDEDYWVEETLVTDLLYELLARIIQNHPLEESHLLQDPIVTEQAFC
jgi:hypothetical protein